MLRVNRCDKSPNAVRFLGFEVAGAAEAGNFNPMGFAKDLAGD